jgi:hypothetical protein
MNNLYEIATVVLGVWVLVLHVRLNRKTSFSNKLSVSLDRIAEGKWEIRSIDEGFEVIDKSARIGTFAMLPPSGERTRGGKGCPGSAGVKGMPCLSHHWPQERRRRRRS